MKRTILKTLSLLGQLKQKEIHVLDIKVGRGTLGAVGSLLLCQYEKRSHSVYDCDECFNGSVFASRTFAFYIHFLLKL